MKNTNEINETIKVYSIENPELDRNDILNLMYINSEISTKQYNILIL